MKVAPSIYDFTTGPVRLTVADVTAHSGRLDAWVEVFAGTKRVTYGDYNLRGARTVSSLARACAEVAPSSKVNWLEWLGECCYEVIHDVLEGVPPVELTPVGAEPPGWTIRWLIGDVGATSLIGYGETGKSLLALAAACTITSGDDVWLGLDAEQEGPVIYCDWEAGEQVHAWRLSQLCAGVRRRAPKGILYRREGLPLARSVASLARHVATANARLLIVDSVMLARGTTGDYGAEGTVQLYAALAQIGCPALLVDHRAKPSKDPKQKSDDGPWGSVINLNSLRLAWSCSTVGVPGGADIRLRKVKANYHGALRDHNWEVRFTDDNHSCRFARSDQPLIDGEVSRGDKVLGALLAVGYAGLSAKELAAEVGLTDNNARAALSLLKKDGKATLMGGRWVAESQSAQEEAPF